MDSASSPAHSVDLMSGGDEANDAKRLRTTIATLNAQRAILGDDVVNTAIAPLRNQLDELEHATRTRRRQVTVMFADLIDYTSLSEHLDPEHVGSMLGRFWGGIDDMIRARRGVVYSHMGDGIMAVWGDTTSAEDDAEQAVRCGLAMLDVVNTDGLLIAGTRVHAKMRVGINTGLVHLSNRDTRTAIGDTVNVAARLEGAAAPGSMVISRSTFGQVRGVFELEDAGELTLKGRTETVRAYTVLRPLPRAFPVRRQGIEGIDTEMAGRAEQFATIIERHEHAIASGESCVTTIVGEPGIGKSRMLAECRDWLETSHNPIRYFEGRCHPDSALQPFALVRSVLAHRFEISDDDEPSQALEKLSVGLMGLIGDSGRALVTSIGWLLGFDRPAESGQQRADTTFRRTAAVNDLLSFFQQLPNEDLGVMLVMEDLHWADDASLDLFERLLADPPHGFVVVAATRDELLIKRKPWGLDDGLCSNHRALTLDELNDDDAAALVNSILRFADEIPLDFRTRLVEQSSGNPFHLEELIKMFIDDGVITTGDTWTIDVEQLDAGKVPSTLTGVLQSRLDHLTPADFLTLQAASVLGRVFWDSAVATLITEPKTETKLGPEPAIGIEPAPSVDIQADAASAFDSVSIDTGIAGLLDTDLIQRSPTSRFTGIVEAAFRHDVTRAVTYDTIALDQRPTLHARAAAWLIPAAGDRVGEYALTIARHLDAADEPSEAADWYLRAAHQAAAQSSYVEALRWHEAAADRVGDVSRRIDIQLEQIYVMITIGRHADAKQLVEPLIDPASGATMSQSLLARGELARIFSLRDGDFEGAERVLRDGIALQHLVPDDDVSRHFLDHQLGILQIITGRYDQAVTTLGDVVDRTVDGVVDPLRRGWVMNALAHVHAQLGHRAEATQLAIETQAIATEFGDPRLAMAAIAQRGLVALHDQDWPQSRVQFEKAQDLNRRNADVEKLATVANYLGETSLELGELERARGEFDEALDISRRAGVVVDEVRAVVGLAGLAAEAGAVDLAADTLAVIAAHPSSGGEAQRLAARISERHDIPGRGSDPTIDPSDVSALIHAMVDRLHAELDHHTPAPPGDNSSQTKAAHP